MFCEYCGYKNTDDAAFCNNCGHALNAPSEAVGVASGPTPTFYSSIPVETPAPMAAAPSTQAPQPQKSNRPLLIGILVVLVIVALVLVGVLVIGGGSKSSQPAQPSQSSQPNQSNSAAEQTTPQNTQQNSQQQNGQSQNGQQTPSEAAGQNPSSINATNGEVTLKGKLVRQGRTTDETGMGWASLDYMLELENPVSITYKAPWGVETNTFAEIQVSSVINSLAVDPHANEVIGSLSDPALDPYVNKNVAVTGTITNTGNAHTYGNARFAEFSISLV